MNRLESWMLHLSTVLLTVTGVVYAWMRYLMEPSDPFSVVNHPLEPYMIDIHIIVAPVLVLGFGIIFHSHILFKKEAGARTSRRTGLVLIPTFGVMVASGYLLQIITSDFRKVLVIVHLVSGGLWALLYLGHQVSSFAQRRSRTNGNRYRVPVQALLLGLFLTIAATVSAEPFERTVQSMGTTLRLTLLEKDHTRALEDSEALIRSIEQVDQQLSTWKRSSELSALNRASPEQAVQVSAEMFHLLKRTQEFVIWTDGAFDPGVGRLIEAWDAHGKFRIPTEREIGAALDQTGMRHLSFDPERGTITKSKNILIDPGAFGKGEALDRAMELAKQRSMAPWMIDFGGQIAVHGIPQNDRGWTVLISKPENRKRLTDHTFVITKGSVSTSGYSERSAKVGDRIVTHILNPQTGQPVEPFGSVTVWHESGLVADVLSTALYVMGPQAGFDWASKNRIAAAFATNGKLTQTPEFMRLFVDANPAIPSK